MHFQMTSWPDFGVPSSAESMLHIHGLVRKAQADRVEALGDTWTGHPRGPPIVIHCSAGIGRTGTFATVDINVSRLAGCDKVEVFQTVEHLRTQRAMTVQTLEQYEFIHLAILEHALTMLTVHEEQKQEISAFLEDWKALDFDDSDSD